MGVWQKIRKYVGWALAAYLIVFALGVFVPPLHHKSVGEGYKAYAQNRSSTLAPAGSERILNIEDNTEALVWRLRAIEAAQNEIILSTFDFDSDTSGKIIMAALQNKARQGVKVQVIMDGVNGLLSWCTGKEMRAFAGGENIQVMFYNPINLLKPWRLPYRLHDKYLMVDDSLYILGGRNTNDLFLGDYSKKPNHDRDLLVYKQDAAVHTSQNDLKNYFEVVWQLPENQLKASRGKKQEAVRGELQKLYDELPQIYPQAFTPVNWQQETFAANSVTLLANPVEAKPKEPWVWYSLQQMVKPAQEVTIQTPYIVCGRDMYRELGQIAQGTNRLKIITNAVANGANPFGCTDYLNNKGKISNTGAEIYELYSEIFSHTKTIVADNGMSFVGSYNLDMRSTYLNTELMLAVDSPELNSRLQAAVTVLEGHSNQVLPDGTETPGENCVPVKMSLGKKILYGLMRLLTLPLRYLI